MQDAWKESCATYDRLKVSLDNALQLVETSLAVDPSRAGVLSQVDSGYGAALLQQRLARIHDLELGILTELRNQGAVAQRMMDVALASNDAIEIREARSAMATQAELLREASARASASLGSKQDPQ